MQGKYEEVLASVLERVTPNKDEQSRMERLAKKLERKVGSVSQGLGVESVVRVEGSVARDTWVSREPDIDVFLRVPTTIPRSSLGEVALKIARKATEGSEQIERFAEHPYLEAIVEGTRVNIVPCYDVKKGEWLSATDRTPFHTDYVNKHLNEHMRSQVRLLKKFMTGIGVYGAEIKVGGFSGYLCELLILHYKSFLGTMKAFAQHKKRIVVDIEDYYRNRKNELDLLFDEPLVIIDPVDKARNVSSAVRSQKLDTFVAASRVFLTNPGLSFFYPRETAAMNTKELKQKMHDRGSSIVFVVFGKVCAVPDILWGQLYKSQRSLEKLLRLSDFEVLREAVWSDEKDINMFVFELEQRCLPLVRNHLGPPLDKDSECAKFLAKYLNNSDTVCGPFIQDGRWVVQVKRRHTDAKALLRGKLGDGGRNAGVAEQISVVLRKGFQILVDDEIVEIYKKSEEFAKFLTAFLIGRPRWLETG